MDEDRIRHLLDYLGQAISAEDWKGGVSACWTFPAMFVSEASERSHYLLQVGVDGQPRIRVALTRAK